MTFALQAEIKQIAHEIRQRFDQVETVAKQELHTRIEQMRALVAKLPGEVEVVEAEAVNAAPSFEEAVAGRVKAEVETAREEFSAALREALKQAAADERKAQATIADLEIKLAAALAPAALSQQSGLNPLPPADPSAAITQTTNPATPTT